MPAARRSPEAEVVVVLALMLLALYGALVHWLPSHALWGGDQAMKFLQIEALSGSPARISLDYAGASLAPEDRFAPFHRAHAFRHDGHWYSVFPLAYAALTVLPYRALGFPGLFLIPVLSVIASALLAYALARRLCGHRDAVLAMGLTALGSPLLIYSAVLWEHALATALAAGVVVCLTGRGLLGAPRSLLLAGVLAGVATWVRSEMYVFIAACAIALVVASKRPWRTGWFIAAAIAALVPLWVLNVLLYGDPAGAHISYNFFGADESWVPRLTRHFAMRGAVANDAVPYDSPIWWLAYGVAACGAWTLWRQSRSHEFRVGIVALAGLLAAAAATADLARGVFVISLLAACPWVVLLAGLPGDRGHSESVRFLMISSIGYVALVVIFSPVPGGVHWGGRMLLPIVPLLAVLAVVGRARLFGPSMARVRPAARMGIAVSIVAALAAGVLVQIGGVLSLHTFKLRNHVYADAIVGTGDTVFVSSARWPVLAAAPVWEDRIFLRADTKEDYCTLVQRFAASSVPSFTYLAAPFAKNFSRSSCVGRAGYDITGRSIMRPGSVIRGIHYRAQNSHEAGASTSRFDETIVPGIEQPESAPAATRFVEVPDAFVRDKAPWFRSPFDVLATDMDLDGDPDLLINWHHHERLELFENRQGRFVLRNPVDGDHSGLFDNPGIPSLFASEAQMKQRIEASGIAGLHLWHDINRGGFWRLLWHDPDSVFGGEKRIVQLETTLPILETTGVGETGVEHIGDRKLRFEWTEDAPTHDQAQVIGIRSRRVATGLRLRVEAPESGRAVPLFVGSASTRAAGAEVHLWKPDPHGIAWLDVAGSPHPDVFIVRGGLGGELQPPAEPKRDRYYVAQAGALPMYRRAPEASVPASYGRGRRVEWVDVDGDGDLDLSIANESTPNELLMLDASSGRFRDEAPRLGLALERGSVQAWGDLDADGRPDLFYLSADRIDVLRNTGGSAFQLISGDVLGLKVPEFEDGPGVIDPAALHLVDFDNDGDLDLCLSAFGKSGSLRMFRNDRVGGEARFSDVTAQLGLSTLDGVRIALFEDFDGDSFVDLVLFGRQDRFLHNQRGQGFRLSPIVAATKNSRTLAASLGDFDGDGRPDLVAIGKQRRLLRNSYDGSNGHLVVELRAASGATGNVVVGALVRGYYADGTVRVQRYGSARNSAFSQVLQPLHFGSPQGNELQSIGVRWPGESLESRTAVSVGMSHLVIEAGQ